MVVFEVLVFFGWNHDKVDPSSSDVLVVLLVESLLAVFDGLEEDSGLSSLLSVSHDTNFDGVFDKSKSMEELDDILSLNAVWKTLELHGVSVWLLVLFTLWILWLLGFLLVITVWGELSLRLLWPVFLRGLHSQFINNKSPNKSEKIR